MAYVWSVAAFAIRQKSWVLAERPYSPSREYWRFSPWPEKVTTLHLGNVVVSIFTFASSWVGYPVYLGILLVFFFSFLLSWENKEKERRTEVPKAPACEQKQFSSSSRKELLWDLSHHSIREARQAKGKWKKMSTPHHSHTASCNSLSTEPPHIKLMLLIWSLLVLQSYLCLIWKFVSILQLSKSHKHKDFIPSFMWVYIK